MAKKRKARRRKNPTRAHGMLLVNPRRKRRKARSRVRNRKAVRLFNRRRNRRPNRRRNLLVVRNRKRNRTRNRRRNARRFNTRRFNRRHTPKVVYRYKRNRKHNRRFNRRSNRRQNQLGGGLEAGLKRIPFVGPLLASMLGFVPQSVFGALSVEPTMWVAKALAPYAPQMPASVFYGVTSLLVASLIQFIPGLPKATKQRLAIAVASAGGGVAYYKARTGADAEMATEAGLLELRGIGNLGGYLEIRPGANDYSGYGDGLAYRVTPAARGYPNFNGAGHYGALIARYYGNASPSDALVSGNDLAKAEVDAAAGGPWSWLFAYPLVQVAPPEIPVPNGFPPVSEKAGLEGHRWGWLIKLVGFDEFQRVSQLPEPQRQAAITAAQNAAVAAISESLAAQQGGNNYAGLIYGI